MRTARVECRKWPDSPHWEFDALRLGADAFGSWVGLREGTVMSRPGVATTVACDHVTLAPHQGWWLATFYGDRDPRRPFDTYVDISTPPYWETEALLRAIDLDLDVIKGTSGRVFVDDEDEFAEHRVTLGYPNDIVEAAVESCRDVEDALRRGTPPFDAETAVRWIARLRNRPEQA